MEKYVLAFRSQPDRVPTADEEAAWGAWFGQLGPAIVDFGNRVGRARLVGGDAATGTAGGALSGYVVISAADIEEAIALAKGCPGLRSGGAVEVGEVVPAS
jgi:YCII-related domain